MIEIIIHSCCFSLHCLLFYKHITPTFNCCESEVNIKNEHLISQLHDPSEKDNTQMLNDICTNENFK